MQHRPFPLHHQRPTAEWGSPFAPVVVRPEGRTSRHQHAVDPIPVAASAAVVRPAAIYRTLGLRDDPFPHLPANEIDGTLLVPAIADQAATLAAWMTETDRDGSLAIVTGPARSGRSTLMHAVERRSSQASSSGQTVVVPVDLASFDGTVTDGRVLRAIVTAFGADPIGRTGIVLVSQIHALAKATAANGRTPVLVLDGADLAGSRLDILRSLLGDATRTPNGSPLRIAVTGTPDFRDRILRRPSLRDRLALNIRIAPFTEQTLSACIRQRLAAVSLDETSEHRLLATFTPEAVSVVTGWSAGVIGPAIELAGECVLEAIARGTHLIDRTLAYDVAREFTDRAREVARHQAASPFIVPAVQARLALSLAEEAIPDGSTPSESLPATTHAHRMMGDRS
ncbi:MAG: ATP-binding protein [Thermomicrobiales bacterium]